MIANLFNKNIVKVLSFFLISPGSKWTRKEVKEKTEMNNIPLDNTLNKLLKLEMIKREKSLLMLNPENEFKMEIEKIRKEFIEFNLPLKIFYIILEVSDKFFEIRQIKNAILFGSYAKLIYNVNSDIDLAIITEKKSINFERGIKKAISKIGKRGKRTIELHFFLEKDLKHKEDPLIKDILRGRKLI